MKTIDVFPITFKTIPILASALKLHFYLATQQLIVCRKASRDVYIYIYTLECYMHENLEHILSHNTYFWKWNLFIRFNTLSLYHFVRTIVYFELNLLIQRTMAYDGVDYVAA